MGLILLTDLSENSRSFSEAYSASDPINTGKLNLLQPDKFAILDVRADRKNKKDEQDPSKQYTFKKVDDSLVYIETNNASSTQNELRPSFSELMPIYSLGISRSAISFHIKSFTVDTARFDVILSTTYIFVKLSSRKSDNASRFLSILTSAISGVNTFKSTKVEIPYANLSKLDPYSVEEFDLFFKNLSSCGFSMTKISDQVFNFNDHTEMEEFVLKNNKHPVDQLIDQLYFFSSANNSPDDSEKEYISRFYRGNAKFENTAGRVDVILDDIFKVYPSKFVVRSKNRSEIRVSRFRRHPNEGESLHLGLRALKAFLIQNENVKQ